MWIKALKFLSSYWKYILLLGLISIIGFQHIHIGSLQNKIEAQQNKLKQNADDLKICHGKVEDLSKSITDLKARNDVLKTEIDKSKISISDIQQQTDKILKEIRKKSVPEDCEGQINYLRERAIERQQR